MTPDSSLGGTFYENIVNRLAVLGGIQLEAVEGAARGRRPARSWWPRGRQGFADYEADSVTDYCDPFLP